MTSNSQSTKDDFKQSGFSTQTHFPTALSPNHALVTVAQEVAERLQQAYPPPSDDTLNHPENRYTSNRSKSLTTSWRLTCEDCFYA